MIFLTQIIRSDKKLPEFLPDAPCLNTAFNLYRRYKQIDQRHGRRCRIQEHPRRTADRQEHICILHHSRFRAVCDAKYLCPLLFRISGDLFRHKIIIRKGNRHKQRIPANRRQRCKNTSIQCRVCHHGRDLYAPKV